MFCQKTMYEIVMIPKKHGLLCIFGTDLSILLRCSRQIHVDTMWIQKNKELSPLFYSSKTGQRKENTIMVDLWLI